ncbi:hypothetical protein Tco_0068190 [Tanacetum coccineum]
MEDFKKYEMMFMGVDVPMEQPQPVVSAQGTHRSTPRAIRSPTISASPQERKKRKQTIGESSSIRITIKKKKPIAEAEENIAKVQEKLDQEEIDKMLDGDEDEEYYASAFIDSVFNDDDDDTGSKIEPESHKERPEHVSDDD